ncbi:hypothetical protein TNCV_168131 [Trichonephila clavipes]|nr:hypothetical protein TNCV_168131 [Trichonephila clavipes]
MPEQRRAKLRKKKLVSQGRKTEDISERGVLMTDKHKNHTHIGHRQTTRSAGIQKERRNFHGEGSYTLEKKPVQRRTKRNVNKPVRRGKEIEEISKKRVLRTKYTQKTKKY